MSPDPEDKRETVASPSDSRERILRRCLLLIFFGLSWTNLREASDIKKHLQNDTI